MNRPLRSRPGDNGWMIHIKIRDFLTVFCVLRSGVFIEDGFARRAQGPSTSVKKEIEFKELLSLLSGPPLTGQRPPVAIGGHATYSGTGPGMQQVIGKPTESSATLPAPIRVGQIQETGASHSWRPVTGHLCPQAEYIPGDQLGENLYLPQEEETHGDQSGDALCPLQEEGIPWDPLCNTL